MLDPSKICNFWSIQHAHTSIDIIEEFEQPKKRKKEEEAI